MWPANESRLDTTPVHSNYKDVDMLVLTRLLGESIDIEGVKVTVLDIHKKWVSIGIDAPKCVKVVRSELLSKQEESDGISNTTTTDLGESHVSQPDRHGRLG